jgi:hypothetical protein
METQIASLSTTVALAGLGVSLAIISVTIALIGIGKSLRQIANKK